MSLRLGRIALGFAADEVLANYRYEKFLDLRYTRQRLPAGLHYNGRHSGIHKIEVFGVARLGLRRTKETLACLVPSLDLLRIYRIDACVDLLDISPRDLASNCHIPSVQNFRMYRSRGAFSFYLQSSAHRTLLIYDRARRLKSKGDPLGATLAPDDKITRIEVQLKGKVPYPIFRDIHKYADYEWLGALEFLRLQVDPENSTAMQMLAAEGLRHLVSRDGLQAVAKGFTPPQWAGIKKKYYEPMTAGDIPPIRARLRRSVTRWMKDQIHFPRLRESGGPS